MSIQEERDRPAAEAEIEVTSEMAAAGVAVLARSQVISDLDSYDEIVREVYRAMRIREG